MLEPPWTSLNVQALEAQDVRQSAADSRRLAMADHRSMRILSEEDVTELKNAFARGEAPKDIATRMRLPAYRVSDQGRLIRYETRVDLRPSAESSANNGRKTARLPSLTRSPVAGLQSYLQKKSLIYVTFWTNFPELSSGRPPTTWHSKEVWTLIIAPCIESWQEKVSLRRLRAIKTAPP